MVAPLYTSKNRFVPSACLASIMLLPKSIIVSQLPMVDVKRTTVTIVKPPFVAILNVRDPASRNCKLARLKLTCPLPLGPPRALYVGKVPIAALFRVDIDANEGFGVSAMNLAQAVLEYDATTFETPEYAPALHTQAAAEVAPAVEVVPAGHATHAAEEFAPIAPEYVPAGQDVHVAGHPVTCTSAKLNKRSVPYIEIWRY